MTTEMDKDEIVQDLQHHRQMVRDLKRYLQVLERTKALKGLDTEPHVLLRIEDYVKDIQRHEEQIIHLKTLAAQDTESLAEVEYRMLAAEAWDVSEQRPSVAAAARLEYNRLRLGVTPARAQEIEHEIRARLVEELFRHVKRRFYRSDTFDLWVPWHIKRHLFPKTIDTLLSPEWLSDLKIMASVEYPLLHDEDEKSLALIVKCIMLDHATTLEMFIENFSKEPIEIKNICYNIDIPSEAGIEAEPHEEFNDPTFWLEELFNIFQRNLRFARGASGVDTDAPIARFVNELYAAVTKSQ